MYIEGIGWIDRMGDPLTDEQQRQIAASRNAGISQSVKAAEAAGSAAQSVAAFDQAVNSAVAARAAGGAPASHLKTWLLIGGAGVVLYLILRRPRASRKLHSRKRGR